MSSGSLDLTLKIIFQFRKHETKSFEYEDRFTCTIQCFCQKQLIKNFQDLALTYLDNSLDTLTLLYKLLTSAHLNFDILVVLITLYTHWVLSLYWLLHIWFLISLYIYIYIYIYSKREREGWTDIPSQLVCVYLKRLNSNLITWELIWPTLLHWQKIVSKMNNVINLWKQIENMKMGYKVQKVNSEIYNTKLSRIPKYTKLSRIPKYTKLSRIPKYTKLFRMNKTLTNEVKDQYDALKNVKEF